MNRLSNWSNSDVRGYLGLFFLIAGIILFFASIPTSFVIYQDTVQFDVFWLLFLISPIPFLIVGFYFRQSLPDTETTYV